jgi:Ca2+-binding EF-hand superfamily protein
MKKLWILALVASASVAAADRVKQYDFDGDGKVSFEDLTRYCTVSKSLFDRADKNGDGYLSNSELRTAKDYILPNCQNKHK